MAARLTLVASLFVVACAPSGSRSPGSLPPAAPQPQGDSLAALIPPGLGTLRQDDVALRVQVIGLQVRAIPLDESVIRVLSPDSYRALHDLATSQSARAADVQRRNGLSQVSLWYLSFYGLELGETRFSAMEVIISNVGRDFRPLDVIPISAGFGSQRLRQKEVQHGLYLFEGQLDINQPLTLSYETARSSEWSTVLERIERERALVRSRVRP